MPKKLAREGVAPRVTLSLRTTPEIRARLERDAISSGRALAQEAEARFERSYDDEQTLRTFLGEGRMSDAFRALQQIIGKVSRNEVLSDRDKDRETHAAIDALARVYFLPVEEWTNDPGKGGAEDKDNQMEPGDLGRRIAYDWLRWNDDPRLDAEEQDLPQRSLDDIMNERGNRDTTANGPRSKSKRK